MGDLLATELRRRKVAAELKIVLDPIRAQPGEPMVGGHLYCQDRGINAKTRSGNQSGQVFHRAQTGFNGRSKSTNCGSSESKEAA